MCCPRLLSPKMMTRNLRINLASVWFWLMLSQQEGLANPWRSWSLGLVKLHDLSDQSALIGIDGDGKKTDVTVEHKLNCLSDSPMQA